MKILFWDIDGTLIRTAKAGLYALDQAAAELYGVKVDFGHITMSGMTDNHIAAQILRTIGRQEPDGAEIARLTCRYEELLPERLQERGGVVLPAVREILEALWRDERCVLLLLTGNSCRGAQIKLDYFGLAKYFNFAASAFCGHRLARNDIAAHALATATRLYPGVSADDIVVIGDTPDDIACGKFIGAKTVAVATGHHSLEALAAHAPWWAVGQLPGPDAFVAKLAL